MVLNTTRAGEISSIVKQRKPKDRVSIFVDGEFAFGISVDTLLEFGLYKGRVLTDEESAGIVAKDERRRATARSIHFVGHRPRTCAEVLRKLRSLDYSAEAIQHALAYLKEYGYLDDEMYASEFVVSRFRTKGHGPRRLRSELIKKGVGHDIIDAALRTLPDEDAQLVKAIGCLEKKYPSYLRDKDIRRRKNKAVAFLSRRGYSFQICDAAYRVVSENHDKG